MADNSTDDHSLDAAAANLQETAKSTLETAQKNAEEGKDAGVSIVQKMATIVLDKGNQAADSSKTYLANVVHQVQDYAEHASQSPVVPQGLQDTVSKALHLNTGSTDQSSNTNGSSSSAGTSGANNLITSILAWISQLCSGSKKDPTGTAGGENTPASDSTSSLRSAADQVSSVLHEAVNSITTTDPAAHPPPAAAAAKEEESH